MFIKWDMKRFTRHTRLSDDDPFGTHELIVQINIFDKERQRDRARELSSHINDGIRNEEDEIYLSTGCFVCS